MDYVHCSVDDDGIGLVTIDNPPLNVLSAPVRRELAQTFEALARRDDLRVVILRGEGTRSFCAGASLRDESELNDDTVWAFRAEGERMHRAIRDLPCPVIGAINGYALGGGLRVALACDIRIASSHAKFGAVAARIGLTSSSYELVLLLGPARAKEIAFTARHIPAEEAVQLGLCNKVVPPDELLPTCYELARAIASRAPLAIRRIKDEMNRAFDLSAAEAQALANKNWIELRRTEDHREALTAFFEKREPRFRGR